MDLLFTSHPELLFHFRQMIHTGLRMNHGLQKETLQSLLMQFLHQRN